ncbi:hypothetical protein Ssi02_55460 [Sinosporangium siamense]|uniref:Uncharacterized protein n=1 Tax=Sinosporangium siamense TaxID=1367973 RepID=A0A919RM17_9ACTN|nr:hypothetical protein Ssi02_55460 [Sinosporangium siamense]
MEVHARDSPADFPAPAPGPGAGWPGRGPREGEASAMPIDDNAPSGGRAAGVETAVRVALEALANRPPAVVPTPATHLAGAVRDRNRGGGRAKGASAVLKPWAGTGLRGKRERGWHLMALLSQRI